MWEKFTRSGERLGVVGRTGAGKSTLAMALFRIVEPTAGRCDFIFPTSPTNPKSKKYPKKIIFRIMLSNRDVTTVGLQELRSSLTIIPQVKKKSTLASNPKNILI